MILREAEMALASWKEKPDRKPLILRGARQVGKTTLIDHFADSYDHAIKLNLEKPQDASFFNQHDDAKTLVQALLFSSRIPPQASKATLLFLDEIQASPKAIQLLRYLYEDVPELHVIAAGSLLEFSIKEVKSFPVGRVEYLYLHPINFREYLRGAGNQLAIDQLQSIPVQEFAHETLMSLFHDYALIGGMPEVVNKYVQTGSIASLPSIYEGIWETYLDDVEKYSETSSMRRVIRHVIESAPLQLDKRVKFQNFGNSTYRSQETKEAFWLLEKAQLIRQIRPTTGVEFPLVPDLKKAPRLQLLDTGILNYTLNLQLEMLTMKDLSTAYKGALIPHLVTQELISISSNQNSSPNFWVREKSQSQAEVDLVIPVKGLIIPVEIKSGRTGTLRSLHQFIDQSPHPYAVRIYGGKFSIESHKTPLGTPYKLMNLPYYLGTELRNYLSWFVENP